MSAETFTTAMFLITAVIASGVLINAVFPVVYNMAGTFSSATHESDQRLRTDFKIVTYYYLISDNKAEIWMKNIGSSRIYSEEIIRSDVFCGPEGKYGRLQYKATPSGNGQWTTEFSNAADKISKEYDLNGNGYWDSGETLHITAYPTTPATASGDLVYFQFILPDAIWRSVTFPAS